MRLVKINYSIWWTQDERKTNGRSYTSNEHLHKIKGRQFLVTIFEHLEYSKPLPHSTACNICRQQKLCHWSYQAFVSHYPSSERTQSELEIWGMGHQKSGRLGMTCFSTTQTCLNLADRSLGRSSSIGSRKDQASPL